LMLARRRLAAVQADQRGLRRHSAASRLQSTRDSAGSASQCALLQPANRR